MFFKFSFSQIKHHIVQLITNHFSDQTVPEIAQSVKAAFKESYRIEINGNDASFFRKEEKEKQ